MKKLTLAEILSLKTEVGGSKDFKGILFVEIPFPLKHKINNILVPEMDSVLKAIGEKEKEFALANGAEPDGNIPWKFKMDDKGQLQNMDGFIKFQQEYSNFLFDESNSIEIQTSLKLSLFAGVKENSNYPVLCKLIEDDIN